MQSVPASKPQSASMEEPERLAIDWFAMHGHRGDQNWPGPRLVARSDQANRKDQGNMTKANEFLDDDEVLDAKMTLIADLIRQSRFTSAYTGAGLSRASGIPDYATKATNSVVVAPKLRSNLDARPTYAHLILTELERHSMMHAFVQQNHDGLPQKAGFPQSRMNEIHGAWFDPSNPVVQFSGNLRGDLFTWMAELERKTDLCLCLGTSLSGMNADRMARTPAKRSLRSPPEALGTVIINIQQTPLDERTTVRVWAKLDDALRILAEKLGIDTQPMPPEIPIHERDVFHIPYDANGRLIKRRSTRSHGRRSRSRHSTESDAEQQLMVLDLTNGAEIRIAVEGASNENCVGYVAGKRDGHWRLHLNEMYEGKMEQCIRLLGWWWIESALLGLVPTIPVVNCDPKFVRATTSTSTTSTID